MIHLLALAFYIGALVLWTSLLVRGPGERGASVATTISAVAVTVHAVGLGQYTFEHGELPFVGLGAVLSSLAFAGGLALLVVLALREVSRLALALLPFIVLVQGTALILGIRPSPMSLDFQGAGFALHVGLAILGVQGLVVAFAAGVLYLVQHHELKAKRLGRLFSFIPPLATLDRVGRIGLWGGFVSLSLALVLGWGWTVQNRGSLEFGDPKVVWAVGCWMVFLGILGARRGRGRSEYRSALAAVVGFALVMGTYLALRLTSGEGGFFL
ncbi:MAG: cytochrome c biogenesis protein CcsA [Gemmatimonadota bacterium]